jgi:hypothetical protein
MAAFALMAIALAFPKPFDVFPVDAPIHLIGEGVTDLRCHHPERDYSNLIHLPGLTVSQPRHSQRTPEYDPFVMLIRQNSTSL